jgi:protein SCO1/2
MIKALFTVALLFGALSQAADLPSDSLYHWDAKVEDHTGAKVTLATVKGKPVLVTMFYSTCPAACPIIITSIKRIEKQLPEDVRKELQVVMISMDPERDTPEANRKLMETFRVDTERWHLLRPKKGDVQEIAALLGMTYRKNADGSYNHSAEITLLTAAGTRAARLDSPSDDPAEFLQKIQQVARAAR